MDDGTLRLGRTNLTAHADGRQDQLEVLLAIAFRQRLPAHIITSVLGAIDVSRRGDQAHANLRLAFAGLTRAPAQQWPARLAKASALMASGITGHALIRALDLDDFVKFDDDQPRVPAGNGRESGEFGSAGGEGQAASRSARTAAVIARTAPLLALEIGAATAAALSAFAASVGFAAALGMLFVPTPNATSDSGSLPGDSGATYKYDRAEGFLRVRDEAGTVLAGGHRDKAGVFFDVQTGVPFAREVDGALVFDGDLTREKDESPDGPRVLPRADTDDDEPKLCPEPGPDQPGSESASERARAYQEQISRMINPQRPLEYGLAISLLNPLTGKLVHYDECDEKTGTMIEAKGQGFVGLLSFDPARRNVTQEWLDQSVREVEASGRRDVVWYFAEQSAADYARDLFAKYGDGRERILINVVPPALR